MVGHEPERFYAYIKRSSDSLGYGIVLQSHEVAEIDAHRKYRARDEPSLPSFFFKERFDVV